MKRSERGRPREGGLRRGRAVRRHPRARRFAIALLVLVMMLFELAFLGNVFLCREEMRKEAIGYDPYDDAVYLYYGSIHALVVQTEICLAVLLALACRIPAVRTALRRRKGPRPRAVTAAFGIACAALAAVALYMLIQTAQAKAALEWEIEANINALAPDIQNWWTYRIKALLACEAWAASLIYLIWPTLREKRRMRMAADERENPLDDCERRDEDGRSGQIAGEDEGETDESAEL